MRAGSNCPNTPDAGSFVTSFWSRSTCTALSATPREYVQPVW
jgi:hypothetical protein